MCNIKINIKTFLPKGLYTCLGQAVCAIRTESLCQAIYIPYTCTYSFSNDLTTGLTTEDRADYILILFIMEIMTKAFLWETAVYCGTQSFIIHNRAW